MDLFEIRERPSKYFSQQLNGSQKINKQFIANIIHEDQLEEDELNELKLPPEKKHTSCKTQSPSELSDCNIDYTETQEGHVSSFAFQGYYIEQSDLNSEGSQIHFLGPKLIDGNEHVSQKKKSSDRLKLFQDLDMDQISNTMRKALQMVGKISIEESEFYSENFERYNYEINKYNFLVDCQQFFEDLNLTSITYNILFYLLNKICLVYALNLQESIRLKLNIYNLEKFDQFLASEQCTILQDKIDLDVQQRNRCYFKNFQNINLETDVKDQVLKSIISSHILERKYDGNLRIGSRKVLDAIFKHCLTLSKKSNEKPKKIIFLKGALSCLFYMLSNAIFEKEIFLKNIQDSNRFIQGDLYPDLWKLFLTYKKCDDDQLLQDQIFQIVRCSYSKQTYESIKKQF